MGYEMRFNTIFGYRLNYLLSIACLALGLSACGGDDESTGTGQGYVQLYNASKNAPAIHLTMDDTQYTGTEFGETSAYHEYVPSEYELNLSWQDDSESYETLYEETINVSEDMVKFYVVSGDIQMPDILTFDFPYENPDEDDEVILLRFLNVHESAGNIDIYLSKDDETINEAELVGEFTFGELSDDMQFAVEETYKFYVTLAGSNEVLYESTGIYYGYTTQYVMVIRENIGPGDSPFTLDKMSKSSSSIEYPDVDSGAEFRLYNGLLTHELLPEYTGVFDFYLGGIDDEPEVSALEKEQFSQTFEMEFGDYSMDLTPVGDSNAFAKNRLITLNPNSDKTVFFYLTVEEEEDDNDEDTVEETFVYINSLALSNSNRVSLYDHQVNIVNLINEYAGVSVYFVRSNETIDSAEYQAYNSRATPSVLTMINNTYDVFVTAEDDGNELVLATDQIILNEESGDLFLIIEESINTGSGYKLTFAAQ